MDNLRPEPSMRTAVPLNHHPEKLLAVTAAIMLFSPPSPLGLLPGAA